MSNKISMKKLLTNVLREELKASKKQAAEVADMFLSKVETHLLTAEGEVSIGKIGKLVLKSYPAAERYNPAKKRKETRPAYKAVRFKGFAASRR